MGQSKHELKQATNTGHARSERREEMYAHDYNMKGKAEVLSFITFIKYI